MKIESVGSEPDRAGRYRVKLDDGTVLSLYRQTIEDFAICPGRELSEEEQGQLRAQMGVTSAKMRAVRIIAASGVSKKDLKQRLVQKGEAPEHADEAVAWMEQLHLLDDRETARQTVSRCIARGYGYNRARQALYEKKIPREYWDEALADYPDQAEHILAFLRTRLRDTADGKQIRRATEALLRRGHSYGEIRRALEQLSPDAEEYPED